MRPSPGPAPAILTEYSEIYLQIAGHGAVTVSPFCAAKDWRPSLLLLLLLAAQSRRKLEDVLRCLPGRRGCAVLRYNIYITIQQTGLCWTISTSLAQRMPGYLKYIFCNIFYLICRQLIKYLFLYNYIYIFKYSFIYKWIRYKIDVD